MPCSAQALSASLRPGRAAGMSSDICEVVITAEDADWLAGFTQRLVADRLAACGQIIPAIRSIYRWQGAIQDEAEARVALHTRAELVPAIVQRAKEEHPYDVPCVIALPIRDGNPTYRQWVEDGTVAVAGDVGSSRRA
jgi:periplasmic divalent cation tolerance protein